MVILTNPSPLFSFRGGQTQLHCLYLDTENDKELIYIGTNDGTVNVWDLKVSRIHKKLKVGDNACLAILKNGDYFITQEKGDSIKFWLSDNDGWTLAKEIPLAYVGFCKIVIKAQKLFYPMPDGKFGIYDIESDDEIKTIHYKYNRKQGEIMSLRCLDNSDLIFALYEGGILSVWNFEGIIVAEMEIQDTPMCMDFCEQTNEGIIGTNSETLTKFSFVADKLSIMKQIGLINPGVSSIAVHETGKICIVGCWDGRLKYIKMNSLRLLAVITNRPEPVQSVIFSNIFLTQWGKGVVFIAGPEHKVSLCNLYSKELSTPCRDNDLSKKINS